MADREKVLDAFSNCIAVPKCRDCPWKMCEEDNQKKVEIPVTLAVEIMALLKEQDSVEYALDVLRRNGWKDDSYGDLLKEQEPTKVEWHIGRAHCPSCGELFPRKKETQYIRFCSFCGRAVKWDD